MLSIPSCGLATSPRRCPYGAKSVRILGAFTPMTADAVVHLAATLRVAFDFIMPAASLCISIHLLFSVSRSHGQDDGRPRRRLFDTLLCFTLPGLFVVLHTIVQDHQYTIVEDVGCLPATYTSAPAIVLFWLPPLILSAATLICNGEHRTVFSVVCADFWFPAIASRHFYRRRSGLMDSRSSEPSPHCPLLRLLALSTSLAILSITITSVDLYAHHRVDGLQPWLSVSAVHSDFNTIEVWPDSITGAFMFLWWSIPVASGVAVVCIAFGAEVVDEWAGYWQRLSRPWLDRRGEKEGLSDDSASDMVSKDAVISESTLKCVAVFSQARQLTDQLLESDRLTPRYLYRASGATRA
jgi:hypothetical protein